MHRTIGLAAVAFLATISLTAFSADIQVATASVNPGDFQTRIDNPLMPISLIGPTVFKGEEVDPDTGDTIATRVESVTLPDTDVVDGVQVTVVNEKDFQDGELVESTLDFFAQNKNGDVYYFGEKVDLYENGQIVSHEGSWLAGEGQNEPGIAMPAHPTVGQKFNQENAPGIAEDQITIRSVNASVTVAAGSFNGCLKVDDFNPLDDETEQKWFCPDVGFVREQFEGGSLELVTVGPMPAAAPTPGPTATAAPAQPTPTQAAVAAPTTGDGAGVDDAPPPFALAILGLLAVAGLAVNARIWALRRR